MKKGFDFKFWFGIAVSIFFMYLVFREIDFKLLAQALKSVDYRFVAAAVLLTFISYFFRAVRWHYLLISQKKIPLSSLYPATIIGYMANNVLPARLGEFVRAYVLAQREQLETPVVFASLVIDRLFDGLIVLLILLITLFTLRLPDGMPDAAMYLRAGGVLAFVFYCTVLVFLYFLKHQTVKALALVAILMKPFPLSFSNRLIPLLESFTTGISLSLKIRHLAAILGSSVLIWFLALLPIDMVLQGFGIHLPITASMFILVLLVFAVMVPASPGYIGTYHYACSKGLSLFITDDSMSACLALVIHSIGFFPVIMAGFYYLWRDRISLKTVQEVGDAI